MGGALSTTFPMLLSSYLRQTGMLVGRMKESLLAFLGSLPPSPPTFLCWGLLLPVLALPCDLTLGSSLCPTLRSNSGFFVCACVHLGWGMCVHVCPWKTKIILKCQFFGHCPSCVWRLLRPRPHHLGYVCWQASSDILLPSQGGTGIISMQYQVGV